MGLAARLPHLCSSWAGPVEFAALGVVSRRSAPPGQVDNSRVKKKTDLGENLIWSLCCFKLMKCSNPTKNSENGQDPGKIERDMSKN